MKKKINSFFAVITIIIFCLFCSGVIYILSVQNEYLEAKRTYRQIQTDFTEEEADETDSADEFNIDWKKLKEFNPDVVAWICIPDTNISYPVLQGKDNDEYLRHDINHKYSKAGCIFIESSNANPFEDYNTVIYGHNLQSSGMMFSDLKRFSKAAYAEKHPTIYIYLPDNTCLEYTVISFHKVDADNAEIYCTDVSDTASFLQAVNKNNRLNPDIDENKIESVITLSTCTNANQNERFVLHAVHIN